MELQEIILENKKIKIRPLIGDANKNHNSHSLGSLVLESSDLELDEKVSTKGNGNKIEGFPEHYS